MRYIRFFNELCIDDIATVGGKNASLGEMYQKLTPKGVTIPNGFATTSEAYWLLLEENGIKDEMREILSDLDIKDTNNLQTRGLKVRSLILSSTLPKALEIELLEAYERLSKEYDSLNIDVAVRSSGTAEDLPEASFAGQQETF